VITRTGELSPVLLTKNNSPRKGGYYEKEI